MEDFGIYYLWVWLACMPLFCFAQQNDNFEINRNISLTESFIERPLINKYKQLSIGYNYSYTNFTSFYNDTKPDVPFGDNGYAYTGRSHSLFFKYGVFEKISIGTDLSYIHTLLKLPMTGRYEYWIADDLTHIEAWYLLYPGKIKKGINPPVVYIEFQPLKTKHNEFVFYNGVKIPVKTANADKPVFQYLVNEISEVDNFLSINKELIYTEHELHTDGAIYYQPGIKAKYKTNSIAFYAEYTIGIPLTKSSQYVWEITNIYLEEYHRIKKTYSPTLTHNAQASVYLKPLQKHKVFNVFLTATYEAISDGGYWKTNKEKEYQDASNILYLTLGGEFVITDRLLMKEFFSKSITGKNSTGLYTIGLQFDYSFKFN